jgi:hypothetical protein
MTSPRNYLLDLVMGILALVLITSAFLLWVVLPQGYFATRLVWLDIHKWIGLALVISALLHLVIHARWPVRMTQQVLGRIGQQTKT